MKVILSIKPEFVSKIITGFKKFEYRRKIFRENFESVIVYATSPIKAIVEQFLIDGILYHDLDKLWDETSDWSGIDKKFFYEYFKGLKKGYAIKIGQFYSYNVPLRLNDLGMLTPPQSFVYCSWDNNIYSNARLNNQNRETEGLVRLYNLTEEENRIVEGAYIEKVNKISI